MIATVFSVASEASIPDNPDQWPGNWTSIQWGDPSQAFPFAQVKAVRSPTALHLGYRVKDLSPWRNTGNDWTMLFKTGDSVDFQFSTDPAADPNRNGPAPGDKRLLIAPFHQQPDCSSVFISGAKRDRATRVFQPMAKRACRSRYPTQRRAHFDRDPLRTLMRSGQLCRSPIWDCQGPGSATDLRGDFGVIYGDADGTVDQLRSYWSNKATGLVNDVPGEVTVMPRLWGRAPFRGGDTMKSNLFRLILLPDVGIRGSRAARCPAHQLRWCAGQFGRTGQQPGSLSRRAQRAAWAWCTTATERFGIEPAVDV